MAERPVDEFGRCRVDLDEQHNRRGFIEVEGDIYAIGDGEGPVAMLAFELDSEHDQYVESLGNEIDFGTFSVTVRGGARVCGRVVLTRPEAERLCAAIMWQFGVEGEAVLRAWLGRKPVEG